MILLYYKLIQVYKCVNYLVTSASLEFSSFKLTFFIDQCILYLYLEIQRPITFCRAGSIVLTPCKKITSTAYVVLEFILSLK